MKRIVQGMTLILSMAATAVLAAPPQPVEQHNYNTLWFENWVDLGNVRMTVSDPEGRIEEVFTRKGTPVYKLPGKPVDGVYRYELSAATEERKKIVNKLDNGRGDAAREDVAVPFYLQGFFTVEGGVIIKPKDIREEGSEKPADIKDVKDTDEGGGKSDEKPTGKDVLNDSDG